MAKRKGAAGGGKRKTKESGDAAATATEASDKPAKKGRKAKEPRPHKPPVDPFGPDVLPNYDDRGSPADGNWKPSGDEEIDMAALESQERTLFRLMMLRKAERDVARSNAKLMIAQAEQVSITDGFKMEDKRRLHQQADTADRKAAKAEKEFKRAKEGWHATNGMIHRYLTDDPRPLFDKKKGKSDKAAA